MASRARAAPVRPITDAGRLAAFEAEPGVDLPADAREWWGLKNVRADYWIPVGFAPLALDDALETREIWLQVADEEGPAFDENGAAEPRFEPELMPFAMSPGGDGLVIDLRRDKGSHGAVFLWDHERWGLDVPLWPSVGAMLQDIAVALDARTPVLLGHAAHGGSEAPLVGAIDEAGYLNWHTGT